MRWSKLRREVQDEWDAERKARYMSDPGNPTPDGGNPQPDTGNPPPPRPASD